jgi:plasminogen
LSRSTVSGHEQTIQVIRIIVHEEYDNPSRFANDIALLILSEIEPLVFDDYAQPIPLPTQEQQTTTPIRVSGWGTTQSGGSLPDVLKWVDLPIVDDETCARNYPDETILESMLCAGYAEGGKDSCQGDSG